MPASLGLRPEGHPRASSATRELTQWFSVPSVSTSPYLARFDAVAQDELPIAGAPAVVRRGAADPGAGAPWMRRLPHVPVHQPVRPDRGHHCVELSTTCRRCRPTSRCPVPIGLPCDGETLVVLDGDTPAPVRRDLGELHIGGVGLSPGYWPRRGEDGSGVPHRPLARTLHSGSIAPGTSPGSTQDGIVHFLGRTDSQIKSRGYRIELGEIESAVNTVAGVRECAVVGIDAGGFEGTTICCAYVPAPGVVTAPADLRRRLAEALPLYMMPSQWLHFDSLPLNANGKVDRPLLRQRFLAESAVS